MEKEKIKKEKWEKIKEVAERIEYGELRIIIQRGEPVRIEQIVKSIKLDDPDEVDPGVVVL